MQIQERRRFILNELNLNGRVYITELAEKTGTSIETARRDVQALEEEGLLTKIHGGAVKNKTTFQAAFSDRMSHELPQKQLIGKTAASLLRSGDSIFIDCGSTTHAFAACLAGLQNVTVITNSPLIADTVFQANPSLAIYITGGQYAGQSRQNMGTHVLREISQYSTDYAFIGAGGVDINAGITAAYPEEVEVARMMAEHSANVVVLADHSKFGVTSLCKITEIEKVSYIVTDDITKEHAKAYSDAGVNIIVGK